MAVSSRVLRDQRNISRVCTRFSCHFTCGGADHEAVVINLSINGALLSSKFLPPVGSPILLSLKPPRSKETLTLDAKVIRGGWGTSDHGAIGRFGVRFAFVPHELITLIPKI